MAARKRKPLLERNWLDLPASAWILAGLLTLYMLAMLILALILPAAH